MSLFHDTHKNSKETLHKISDLSQRHQNIFFTYRQNERPLTDRQVKNKMGLEDMNEVRPRITELIHENFLKECGTAIDEKTRKPVRLVRVRYYEEPQQKLF